MEILIICVFFACLTLDLVLALYGLKKESEIRRKDNKQFAIDIAKAFKEVNND